MTAAAFLLSAGGSAAEFRRGVWAANDATGLPFPVSGYQIYLIGEMHGVRQNVTAFEACLKRLADSGLRDVAIEEDAVYERAAQDYVTGASDGVPEALCLRAGVLEVVRRLNRGRAVGQLIRVHLTDIDSPASAIRQHLELLKSRFPGAQSIPIPDARNIKGRGLRTVEKLRQRMPVGGGWHGEMRTIEYSIQAYREGLEIGVGQSRGSPYLESREEAVAANLKDVLNQPDCRGVLVQYGMDHVSKAERNDGGPGRDQPFAPLALRLERSGVKVFSLLTLPLGGTWRWRGKSGPLLWNASDARLSTGEPLDRVLKEAQYPSMLYVDPKLERMRLPTEDQNRFEADAYLLFATGIALDNRCRER